MPEHETLVKGDKVLETVEGKVISEKDYSHVLAGYKAAAHNTSLPDDTREHAEMMVRELEKSHALSLSSKGTSSQKEHDEAHLHRIIGGYKATLKNVNVSPEAKDRARLRLRELGVDYEE